jgi:hypothetical protein
VLLRYNEIHDRLIKEAEDECIISAKDVLKELVKIAFTNGSDFAKITTKPVKRQVINPTNGEWEEKEVEEQAVELNNLLAFISTTLSAHLILEGYAIR